MENVHKWCPLHAANNLDNNQPYIWEWKVGLLWNLNPWPLIAFHDLSLPMSHWLDWMCCGYLSGMWVWSTSEPCGCGQCTSHYYWLRNWCAAVLLACTAQSWACSCPGSFPLSHESELLSLYAMYIQNYYPPQTHQHLYTSAPYPKLCELLWQS